MIKISLHQLLLSSNAINSTAQLSGFPAKVSYSIGRVVAVNDREFLKYNEIRVKRAAELAKKDKDGSPVKFPNGDFDIAHENLTALEVELAEMREAEIEIKTNPIVLDEEMLKKLEGKVPPIVFSIDWLFVDPS